eukprot:2822812-Rhodomonas_salina.1
MAHALQVAALQMFPVGPPRQPSLFRVPAWLEFPDLDLTPGPALQSQQLHLQQSVCSDDWVLHHVSEENARRK